MRVFDHRTRTEVELAEGVIVFVIGLFFTGACRFVAATGARAMVCDSRGRYYDVDLREIISIPDLSYAEFIEEERRAPRTVSAWFVDKDGKGERRDVTMQAGTLPRVWKVAVFPEPVLLSDARSAAYTELRGRVVTYKLEEEWKDGRRVRTWYQEAA